jgi:hypothetical protein
VRCRCVEGLFAVMFGACDTLMHNAFTGNIWGWPEPCMYTIYLVLSLPKLSYIHRIYIELARSVFV